MILSVVRNVMFEETGSIVDIVGIIPQHDLHVCLESQVCFCLNPKYPYDHFD